MRKHDKLPSFLSQLSFSGFANKEQMIDKIKAQTTIEQDKANELREVLSAKQELAKARAINKVIRREISVTNETRATIPNVKTILEEK